MKKILKLFYFFSFFVACYLLVNCFHSISTFADVLDKTWTDCTPPSGFDVYDQAITNFGNGTNHGTELDDIDNWVDCSPVYDPVTGVQTGCAANTGGYFYIGNHQLDTITDSCTYTGVSISGTPSSGTVTYTAHYSNHGFSASQTFHSYYAKSIGITLSKPYTYEDEVPPTWTCVRHMGNGVDFTTTGGYLDSSDYTKYTASSAINGDPHPCVPNASSSTNSANTILTVTYSFTDPYSKNSAPNQSTIRYFVENVTIDSYPADVYTGIQSSPFKCTAHYAGGSTPNENISNFKNVWSSYKTSDPKNPTAAQSNFIGDQRRRVLDPRNKDDNPPDPTPGVYQYPDSTSNQRNVFYSEDPTGGSYDVNCTYFPQASQSHWKWIMPLSVSAFSTPKPADVTITNHGILKMMVTVSGDFSDNPNPSVMDYHTYNVDSFNTYKFTRSYYPIGDSLYHDTYSQVDFIAGHWYDFHAYILYDDKSDGIRANAGKGNPNFAVNDQNPVPSYWRDITTSTSGAPEVLWRAHAWYESSLDQPYNTSMYDFYKNDGNLAPMPILNCSSECGTSGLDHRVPRTGWNIVSVQYFDNVAPWASTYTDPNVNSIKDIWNTSGEGKTSKVNMYWAHKMMAITIRGAGTTYDNNPPIVGLKNQVPPNPTDVNTSVDVHTNPASIENYTAWITWSDDPDSNQQASPASDAQQGTGYTPFGSAKSNTGWISWSYGGPNPFYNASTQPKRGQEENWTNIVNWFGDDYTGTPGQYKFQMRGTDYHTIAVDNTGDRKHLESGDPYWTYLYNGLSVYTDDNCSGDYLLIYGCSLPGSNNADQWHVTLQNSDPLNSVGPVPLASPTTSFLAPPSYYQWGPPYTDWTASNMQTMNPYTFLMQFPVTGVSTGAGNK